MDMVAGECMSHCAAPTGLYLIAPYPPTAHAVGYVVSSLRDWPGSHDRLFALRDKLLRYQYFRTSCRIRLQTQDYLAIGALPSANVDCPCNPAHALAPTKSCPPSEPGAWAKCIERETRGSSAPLRSKCCRRI